MNALDSLAQALMEQRDAILTSWRNQVRKMESARNLDVPTLNDHMPVWIAELAATLRTVSAAPVDEDSDTVVAIPLVHGGQRFEDGFDIEEVVGEYNILRDCVHGLAERLDIDMRGYARRVINKIFDDAIGSAVKAFAETQARDVQRRRAEHLAFVAHDLRTPLAAITFSSHILEQRMTPRADPESARLVRILGRNAKQLETLVTQVLKDNTHLLTELGVKVERRSFDLWPVIETLIQDLQPLAEKSATRLVNQVPDELMARADAGLVRRIFQNLVANAIAYTPRGQVTIGAREAPGDAIECWVSDNGRGIARDRIDKVFDALETDPEGTGLGLGLAIVKTFVEAHDGAVTVESAEGQGSTFCFTLPRTVAVARDSVPA